MVWAKNGTPITRTDAGSTLAITDATAQNFNVVMSHCINVTGDASIRMRLNGDSGANYARRRSDNGGTDTTQGSNTYSYWTGSASTGNVFYVSYIADFAGNEKLMQVWNVFANTAGAGNAPTRFELAAKWSNTSDRITSYNADTGGNYFDTNSNISVLGSDAGVLPNNVEDNSIFVEKDTAKIFWSSGIGAITKDSQNTVTNGSTGGQVTTATIPMTVANNSNRVLVVASSAYNANPDITSVTFNGSENFTYLSRIFDGNYKCELWFLVNPTITTANVLVNYGSSGAGQMTAGCYSFYNVKQETPTNIITKDGDSTTTPFTAITPTTTGSMILDVYMNGAGVVASSVNKTLGWSQLAGGADRYQSSQYNLSPTIGSSDTSLSRVLATATNGVSIAVEIKKGNSFWTLSYPPFAAIGRGIFASGTHYNVIDYITIATTGNATDFGDSLKTGHDGSATGSSSRAVFGGGTGTTTDTKLEYISFQTLGNAVGFGAMGSSIGGNSAACGDGSRGIWSQYTTAEYITIDTAATSTSFGTMGNNHGSDPASCADSTRGLWGGGEPSSDTNAISYVTIQTTGNSTDFGDLTQARRQFSAVADATRGCFGGGYNGSYLNTIDYVTIQTTGNATDFGDLTVSRVVASGACGDATRGVWGGGSTAADNSVEIDYITIATTGNATDFGDLTQSRNRTNGASDYVK